MTGKRAWAAAGCALLAIAVQTWYVLGERAEAHRLRSESAALAAKLAEARGAARAALAQKQRQEAADADVDLSRFSEAVRNWVKRLEDPKYFKASAYRRNLDRSYAALFRQLGLPPEKLNSLRDLLGERVKAEEEVLRLSQGDEVYIDGSPDRAKLLAAGTSDTDAQIRQLLGDQAYATFAQYVGTIQTRSFLLQPFADHESFGASAITDDQIDQLAASVPPYYFGVQHFIFMESPLPLPDSLEEAAAHVLSPDQLAAFQAYETVWQARVEKLALDRAAIAKQLAEGR